MKIIIQPPKISGRVIMIPLIGKWGKDFHPGVIWELARISTCLESRTNEKIWFDTRGFRHFFQREEYFRKKGLL